MKILEMEGMMANEWHGLVLYAPSGEPTSPSSNVPGYFTAQKEYIKLMTQTYRKNQFSIETREVYTKSDLRRELKRLRDANKNPSLAGFDMVHFIGHGSSDGIGLTYERVEMDKPSAREMFKDIKVQCLLYSCCDMGKNQTLLDQICVTSKSELTLAYRVRLEHPHAFLIDSLVYHLVWGQTPRFFENLPWKEIVERLEAIIDRGLLYGRGRGQRENRLAHSTAFDDKREKAIDTLINSYEKSANDYPA